MVVSATALTAFGDYLNTVFPFGRIILTVVNVGVSLILISILFAAIYKVLPDRHLRWRDVILGAVVTAVLFTIGKSLIGFYIGSTGVASTYGAAGALIVLLLWVYYSAQIFLLGAEFTKAVTESSNQSRQSQDIKPELVEAVRAPDRDVAVVPAHASSLAAEVEKIARRNPLGALAGALTIGMVLGINRDRG